MTTLYLIRHAEAEGNLYRRSHGWYDSKITDNGARQIAALEQRFDGVSIQAVYSSDLRRTRATAQAILRSRAIPFTLDPDLRELGMGTWEDRTFGDLDYHYPEEMKLFFARSPLWSVPGSETFQQVAGRMTAAIRRIAEARPGETVAVFSHGMAIYCFLSALRGKGPGEVPGLLLGENTAVTKLEYENGRLRSVYENDASHLPREISTLTRQMKSRQGDRPFLEIWFRPLDLDREPEVYRRAREDAWLDIHHSMELFDGPGFLAEAREQRDADLRAVEAAMWNDQTIGVLQMATGRDAGLGVGYVPFVYLQPEYRCRGIGGQLIGEAVCFYRALGRARLRLRCSPDNGMAQRFYRRHGFVRIGAAPGAAVPLDLLEKAI